MHPLTGITCPHPPNKYINVKVTRYLMFQNNNDNNKINVISTIKMRLHFQSIFISIISFFLNRNTQGPTGLGQVSELRLVLKVPNQVIFTDITLNFQRLTLIVITWSESIGFNKKKLRQLQLTHTHPHPRTPERTKKGYQNCSDLLTSQLTQTVLY